MHMICLLCERDRNIRARGLCSRCYESERVSANLDKYADHRRKDGLSEIACKQCGKVFYAYPTTFGDREYCSRHCYELSERIFSQEQEGEIIELYLGKQLSATKISKLFNTSHVAIINVLDRNGIPKRPKWYHARKYNTNEYAFDDLDSEAAAYWLGFIYADGYVRKDSLQMVLKASDLPHLILLSKFLNSDQVARPNKTGGYTISFHGLHLTRRLSSLGIVVKRGCLDRILRELPYQQYRHFIRGYLDGDGYISKIDTKFTGNIGFLGQEDILDWIRQVLVLNCDKIGTPKTIQRSGIKELTFGGKYQLLNILKWLYSDVTIYLPRKYERAIYWMGLV